MNVYDELKELKIENRVFINGCFVDAFGDGVIKRTSSYNGEPLPDIADCSNERVRQAIECAKYAFETGVWSKKKISDRKKVMLKLAELMEKNRRELALLDTYETSRAFSNYYNDSIPKAIEALRYYAEAADKYYDYAVSPQQEAFSVMTRMPLGVVGIITPWNDPMVVDIWKLAPALLMGNSVIAKPAEQSSLSLLKLAQLANEAGVPKGVFNVVTGYGETVGRMIALDMDVRGIYFTGSSRVGKLIMQYAGQSNMKKVGLECGGKSPFIVSSNCRIISAAAAVLASNMFYNQGQICTAPSRVIVDESVYDEFIDSLKDECEKYVPGNPFDDENNVGCVVSREQFERIKNYITIASDEGAEIYSAIQEKDKCIGACCVQPTIITGLREDSRCVKEEIFGPVVVVLKCDGLDEAVRIANDTVYGLAGAVFTDDVNEAYYAANNIDAGLVHINSWGEDEVHTPFGGIKESGLGKDRSMWAFDEYSELKTVWMKFKTGEA